MRSHFVAGLIVLALALSSVALSSVALSSVALSFVALSSTATAASPRTPACGGEPGLGCGAGMFCELPDELCAGADIAGRCEVVPLACPRLVLPVCGCNGRTYANDCERRAARVSQAHQGACL